MSKSGARSDHVIAATFSTDAASIREARYHEGRTTRAIYAVGDRYYATGKTAPTEDVGGPWQRHADQFFAERAGTVLWVAEMGAEDSEIETDDDRVARERLERRKAMFGTLPAAEERELERLAAKRRP